jgi:ATP-dependent DNA ligase
VLPRNPFRQAQGWPAASSTNPKYDGFRCLAFRDGDRVHLQSKNQKALNGF